MKKLRDIFGRSEQTCSCWHTYCCAPPKGKQGAHCGDKENGCGIRRGRAVWTSRERSG